MALNFTGVRADDPINWRVAIQASDEDGTVRCYVTYEALQDHVRVDVDPLEAFDAIAPQVQHALRAKDQVRGRAADGSLTVGTSDL